ncbi:RNase adapter RapZ [Phocicoccus pinnipedialis]|uniref:GlmZ(SRNA)-inactivating NTPase n=1 Tax=Phocicoccus pinnipedialis TaxID=110845 RepID=A0A6V7R3T2_9BACL|nr:RNase adapter RapZ [Jeotgalicoccus pinnipedialis]MBP1938798.1 UPF0042 nucleotide-binding protein [Jeotgalicoccus pinnipedialis]CAD2071582.1 glmZ(sRNA)-inactivating NTPase [Jeotgalicoccus pinnipedialis]
MKDLIILTGMSGAGKSVALDALEDMGYFCIDNLPPVLLPKIVELMESTNEEMHNVALGIDLRGQSMFERYIHEIHELPLQKDMKLSILFLDASDERLISRYKETRRSHPLNKGTTLTEAIREEREILADLKGIATFVFDTTEHSPKGLKEEVYKYLNKNKDTLFTVNLLSFGFKHGLPKDADLVFDVRFLPNPYYIEALRKKTGLDQEVYDYVMKFKDTERFYRKLADMLTFMLPLYVKEGKSQLNIAIGCTGGQHRSVSLVERLSKRLNNKYKYEINTIHRDAHIEGVIHEKD